MKNLIQFLIRSSIFLLFLILETTAFILIIHNTGYQRIVLLSSANAMAAHMYQTSESVIDFFKSKNILRQENIKLYGENTDLRNQIVDLQNEIGRIRVAQTDTTYIPAENDLQYIPAKIINKSTNKHKNYITINKGERDGIAPGMGVIATDGVVGIVKNVSEKFAVVIPILNPEISINAKFKSHGYIGPVVWLGHDYRYANMTDIARHVRVHRGDSIITSGLTTVFPEGIPVGTIEKCHLGENDAYHIIKIRLAVNFQTLSYVRVIRNNNRTEWEALEEESRITNQTY